MRPIPKQIIPDHLIERRDQYENLLERHFAVVSPKAVNQMRRALVSPSNRFWTSILWPNLLMDALGKPSDPTMFNGAIGAPLVERPMYLPVANSMKTMGRNHELAEMASTCGPASIQDVMSLFANPLRLGFQNEKGVWERPSLRVVGGPWTIFTLEYDPPTEWQRERRLEFLDGQLGWFRKSGSNDLDRPIRPVWDWAAKFSDFRGMCANWSGHKSVHIHLVFDTSAIMGESPHLRDHVRDAYIRLWEEMRDEVVRAFPQEIEPDDMLRFPEQYRKLPNGMFVTEKPGHLLGIPVGTEVPLLCLWEKLLERAPAGADRAFVNEGVLKEVVGKTKKPSNLHSPASKIGEMTVDEHSYCSDQFNALIEKLVGSGNFPKGAGLHKERMWIGRLYANEFDKNPSTIIFENRHRTWVQGGKQPDRVIKLPLPLVHLIWKWRREYAKQTGIATLLGSCSAESAVAVTVQRPEEQEFALAATSSEMARQTLAKMLPDLVERHERILIRAPEGLGKTTAIARCLPMLVGKLTQVALASIPLENVPRRTAEWQRPSAFAFSSYELAAEKANEFNASGAGRGLRGVIFPSFTRMYQESCGALDELEVATPMWAALNGEKSLVAAIKSHQPDVWAEMERRHSELHRVHGIPKRTVYFIVHQVLQEAATNLLASAFLHPDFFRVAANEWWRLKDEMRFQVAIHDEVPVEALVTMHHATEVDWCLGLFDSVPDVWASENAGLVEKLRTFQAKHSREPIQISFDHALDIHRANYTRADQTGVAECEHYGDGLLYAGTHGHGWYARKRAWWGGLADRVILLTTEALPTNMVKALDGNGGAVEVFDLRTPDLRSGTIQVRLRPSCSSKDAREIVQELRDEVGDPDLQVITNRAASIGGTSTHAGVRGSNKLVGRNLGQTAFYKAPPEYERLQIINRLFGLSAAIRLRHVDEINQSAGRNLGFRHDGKGEHHLVVGRSLYEEIETILIGECRYKLLIVEDAQRRKRQKYSNRRSSDRRLLEDVKQIAALVGDAQTLADASLVVELSTSMVAYQGSGERLSSQPQAHVEHVIGG